MKTKLILMTVSLVVCASMTSCGVIDGVTINGRYADYEFRFSEDKTVEAFVILDDK